MRVISDRLKAALTKSHTRATVVEVFDYTGQLLAASYSETSPLYAVPEGSVTVDRKAKHTRSADLVIVDPTGTITPKVDQTELDPLYRPQFRLSFDYGWNDDDGHGWSERVPLGVFLFDEVDVEEFGSGTVMQVHGISAASALIEANSWATPYDVSTVLYSSAIKNLLNDRANGWTPTLRFDESTAVVPFGITFGTDSSDPWTDAQKLAEADGKELLTDADGAIILRAIPDLTKEAPVWTYGSAGLRLPGARRSISAEKVCNGVVMRATAPWLITPLQSVVWDTDVSSPTYYLGPFGRKPMQVDNALASDQTQLDTAAAAKLRDVLGVSEDVEFTAVTNAAHEPGDTIYVDSSALGLADKALLDRFTIPLAVDQPMACSITRQRRD